jgi:hypothetical protein
MLSSAAGLCLFLTAVGGEAPSPAANRHFPFRLGDSWTYDWRTEGRVPHTASRTRTFEGVEFVGGGPAFKLVSDDGTYHVYSLREGALYLNSSAQDGRVLYYEPPVPLFSPDLRPGEPHLTVNADTGRRFRTTLLEPEDVETPLGLFRRCLKVRLEMDAPDYSSDSYHYFAPDVGLVAYKYELVDVYKKTTVVRIDARLRLARLAGVPVASRADVDKLARTETVSLGGPDDSSARDLLRRAWDRRYTWDDKFPGFRGDFEYREQDRPPATGSFAVDRSLEVTVEGSTEAARAAVRSQISSFVTFRRSRPFDLEHAGARFRKGAPTPEGDQELIAEADAMGSSYLVRQDEIRRVTRSVGRLRYVVENRAQMRTEDGRTITLAYDVNYFSNEDQSRVSLESTEDSYAKVGAYWLPTGRVVKRTDRGRNPSSLVLRLTNLR